LEGLIKNRFEGANNAHRWQVLKYQLMLKDMAITPKDAEWVQGSNLTFRQVCRGMGVPPALVGDAEYATLANLRVYERALWEHTLQFEAEFIGAELSRQLAPAYQAVSHITLDLGDVVALQEDETERWTRAQGQLALGAITINEWRVGEGLEKVPWGDAWWAPMTVSPVSDGKPALEAPVTEAIQSRALRRRQPRHPRPDFADVTDGLRDDLTVLFGRQKDAILRALKQQPAVRSVAEVADAPFELAKWTERTRAACQARFVAATERALLREGQIVGLSPAQISDLLESRAVRAAIEGNVQRFATHISTTTYNQVKGELEQALRNNETLDRMASRITNVMGGRVEDARRIAVSEVTRSTTTGQMAAYTAAEVPYKIWFTQGDAAVRDTHVPLDGMAIPVGDMFTVGGARGYGPGTTGDPAEDVNCRCYLEPSNEVE
ncbi:MAG: phage portal protein, partial [Planctomycetota bacterium]